MKIAAAIAVLVLVSVHSALGQAAVDRRLAVTGTVASVRADTIGLDKKFRYTISLLLQFRNQTDEPIIIFRPDHFVGYKKISFLRDVSSTDEVEGLQVSTNGNNYGGTSDPVQSLVNYLSGPWAPSLGTFAIIDAGGYYECGEFFRLTTGYKVNEEVGKRLPLSKLPITSEYQVLKISYRLSLSDRKEGTDLLETARSRWRKEYGNLILDSKGDYDITSKIIMNRLSDPSD